MAKEANDKTANVRARATAKRGVAGRIATRRPVGRLASRIHFDERCGMIIDRELWEEILAAGNPGFLNGIYVDPGLLRASEKTLLKNSTVEKLATKVDSGVLAIQTKEGAFGRAAFIEGVKIDALQTAFEVKPVLEAVKPGLTIKTGATLKAAAAKKTVAKKK